MKTALPPPTIVVIIGITGDLSKRKLLPAIEKIVRAGAAPKNTKVIGITRGHTSPDEILHNSAGTFEFLKKNLTMYQMDIASPDAYSTLKEYLRELRSTMGEATQTLFYLSIPPQISQPLIRLMGEAGIADEPNTKLLLEKPFGTDLESAQELVEHVRAYFDEEQVYRIDHYLAKEMTQNLIVFRQGNSLIKRTWNKDFIERIEIIASESIGIEGRADFYEQTGALRDLIQSHLMQLAALVLADFPDSDWKSIPAQRLAALRQLTVPQDIDRDAYRAQYYSYRQEVDNPVSLVETFVRLTLFSDDPRWKGVPITLVTGKALEDKTTEVRIKYRQDYAEEANTLILHIQPNEGVELDMWSKVPGYERKLVKQALAFGYGKESEDLPEAYERVFLDAMKSDHALFTRSEEVLESWRILDPVQKHWEMETAIDQYANGTMPEA